MEALFKVGDKVYLSSHPTSTLREEYVVTAVQKLSSSFCTTEYAYQLNGNTVWPLYMEARLIPVSQKRTYELVEMVEATSPERALAMKGMGKVVAREVK
jgi:hypothetical protein